jgi:hypothetical protein
MTRIYADKREDREAQGYAWVSQAGAVLSNPFASELARDCEKSIAHFATQMALRFRSEIFWRNTELHLVSLSEWKCIQKFLEKFST